MSRISIADTFAFAFRFLVRDAGKVLPRIALSVLAGALVLYVSLDLYLMEFGRYLASPNDRAGSLVLGIATAGLVITLLLHSVTVATLASIAMEREDRGWRYFCMSRRAWRIYAAYLRFLLLGAALIAAVETLSAALYWIGAGPTATLFTGFALILGLLALAIGVGFLIAPVATDKDHGAVVRRSYRLSRGNFWRLAAVFLPILALIFGIETAGELGVRAAGLYPAVSGPMSLAQTVEVYRSFLPHVVTVIAVAYTIGVVLLTAAASAAFRQITAGAEAQVLAPQNAI